MLKKIRFIVDNIYDAVNEVRVMYRVMIELVSGKLVTAELHDERVTHLLEANNSGVMERRALVAALQDAETIMSQQAKEIERLKQERNK